jgi:hypothetical protein
MTIHSPCRGGKIKAVFSFFSMISASKNPKNRVALGKTLL